MMIKSACKKTPSLKKKKGEVNCIVSHMFNLDKILAMQLGVFLSANIPMVAD